MIPKTPYYRYDTGLLKRTIAAAKEASGKIPGAHIHYAVKANNNPEILKIMAQAGLGADCVSGGEVRQALNAGIVPGEIVFAGVGKTDEEIRYALYQGIGCFNVESVEELEIISELASAAGVTAPVALRINPDIGAHTHANITTGLAENKFGINQEKVARAAELVRTLPGLDFKGLHFHIGSQITDMTDFMALCNRINEWQEWFYTEGIKVKSINVGGGLGVDYEHPEQNSIPNFEGYFSTYANHLHLMEGQEFHCELGRSMVAQCGTLIASCIYVKDGTFKKFIIVDAGMNDILRPALYHAYHKVDNISNHDGKPMVYDVVGPICESTDCFAKAIYVPETKRGDLIAICSAGAYGEAMASTYNSRPLPGSFFTKE